jgi:hypothetical protein
MSQTGLRLTRPVVAASRRSLGSDGAQEIIESLVALGTFALALVTWRMAVATREMARASDQQLELLRRQAEAAETANVHTERQLNAIATPRLVVARVQGEEIVGGTGEEGTRWTVMIRNAGQAPAEISEAWVRLAPQQLTLDPIPPGPIAPGDQKLFEAEASPQVLAEGGAGKLPFPLSFMYSGPNGDRFNMQATIRGKDGGERWLVIEPERHKPAGPPPR